MHGHVRVAQFLLDAGVDPSVYNPEGSHAHSTPPHQAVWSNKEPVVRLLVERGARLDVRDVIHDGTPLDWAVHGSRSEIADYLRDRGRPLSASATYGECIMCRNIKVLANFEPPATDDEIRASALQFVRKLSGTTRPSRVNEAAFDRAVDEVTESARRLIASLQINAPPRNREEEARKARERSRERFG
jgi:hypothetical protein